MDKLKKFLKENSSKGFSTAHIAYMDIILYKNDKLDGFLNETVKKLSSDERNKAVEENIATVEAVQTADELIQLMRKMKGPNCHNAMIDKALSMEEEALPAIIERYYRNKHDVFIEAARNIIFYANEKYLAELFRNYYDIQSPYAQSIVCLLIGMAKYDDVDDFLVQEYQRLKRQYPDQMYHEYPYLAIQLLNQD